MQITLTPVRRDDRLSVERYGDTLVLNGMPYDFSHLPEGAVLPRTAVDCDWLASNVTRIGGTLQLTLILPHGASAPDETRYPAPLFLSEDGPVALPPHSAVEETFE